MEYRANDNRATMEIAQISLRLTDKYSINKVIITMDSGHCCCCCISTTQTQFMSSCANLKCKSC